MHSLAHKTQKVGLALSGGAALGIAHIGVLKALEEESIPIDIITGTSAGALIGACYAKEREVAILEQMALGVDWKMMTRLVDPNLILLGKGFLHGKKIKSLLSSILGDVTFEDLEVPFAAVAVDIQNMEEIVINSGPVIEAVRASISVPVIFTPVKWQNRFLVDGGILNPMPVDVARSMGAGIVIAVNVSSADKSGKYKNPARRKVKTKPAPLPESTQLLAVKKRFNTLLREQKDKIRVFDELSRIAKTKIHTGRGKLDPQTPSIFDVLMQLIRGLEYERLKSAIEAADIVISPDVSHVGVFGFQRGEEAITQGYKATKEVLPQLQEMIRRSQVQPPAPVT